MFKEYISEEEKQCGDIQTELEANGLAAIAKWR